MSGVSTIWESIDEYASPYTFEFISKNLKSYPYILNYSNGILSSIVYTVGAYSVTKTLNYSNGILTSIVLSGNGLPTEIKQTNKTLTYTNGSLSSIIYS